MPTTSPEGSRVEQDVVVLGGGPAGCAAAALLASHGHRVTLVRPAVPPAAGLAQSIPPSARRILAELGMITALERAEFLPNEGNTVWWGAREARVEDFPEGMSGFHVDRAGLERVLLFAARAVGTHVLDAAARFVERTGGGWVVRCRKEDGGSEELGSRWVLDATGRTGVVARREGRVPDRSTTTLAIVRRWRRPDGFPGVETGHTVVESYRDGWAWSVPVSPEVRCFTAMVDPRHSDLSAMDLDASLDAEMAKALRIGSLRSGAVPLGPAWACPASLYSATRFGSPGLLLVGDAGSFIDPLSSFGVKKALSSGWLAGITAHTALDDPKMGAAAVAFYDGREKEVYRRYRGRSADFFEECVAAYGHAYWIGRAEAARRAAGDVSAPDDLDAVDGGEVPAEESRRALERIRTLPVLKATPSPSLHTVQRPTVRGHKVVLESHLASDRAPLGIRWVHNVDVQRVVETAPQHPEVPDAWAAYNAGAASVSLPDYLAALATAFAAGLLEHADGS